MPSSLECLFVCIISFSCFCHSEIWNFVTLTISCFCNFESWAFAATLSYGNCCDNASQLKSTWSSRLLVGNAVVMQLERAVTLKLYLFICNFEFLSFVVLNLNVFVILKFVFWARHLDQSGGPERPNSPTWTSRASELTNLDAQSVKIDHSGSPFPWMRSAPCRCLVNKSVVLSIERNRTYWPNWRLAWAGSAEA